MAATIIDASSYIPQESDKLFFDCNALMYIFYTFGNYREDIVKVYSGVFTSAIKNKSTILVPSIFLSEFANTYIRNEYKRYLHSNNLNSESLKFKEYKKTSDYVSTVQDIKNIILNQILSVCQKIDDPFTALEFSNIFEPESTYDFNDRYYGLLAQHYNFKIVTNDADFSSISGISIITNNRRLMSAAS